MHVEPLTDGTSYIAIYSAYYHSSIYLHLQDSWIALNSFYQFSWKLIKTTKHGFCSNNNPGSFFTVFMTVVIHGWPSSTGMQMYFGTGRYVEVVKCSTFLTFLSNSQLSRATYICRFSSYMLECAGACPVGYLWDSLWLLQKTWGYCFLLKSKL